MITVKKLTSLKGLIQERDSHCIIWTSQANGDIKIDNKLISLSATNIITIGNKQKLDLDTASIEGYFVFFDDTDFPNSSIDSVCRIVLLYNHFNMHSQLIVPKENKLEFEQLFVLMFNESANSDKNIINPILSLLLQTLLLKMEQIIRLDQYIDVTKNSSEEELLMKFFNFLEKYYSTKHKVNEYADLMAMSARKLNDIIKLYFGITAKDLISTKLYVEIARKLQFSSESVKEIAYQTGFSSPYHLSHFFTKMKGISPQSYRDLLKK